MPLTEQTPSNTQLTRYRIVQRGKGFVIETDGDMAELEYVTKEAAFEAVAQAVNGAMSEGKGIEVSIPPGPGRWPIE
jgi:hypothetical protein